LLIYIVCLSKKNLELLKKGYNPFEDNSEFYNKHQTSKEEISAKKKKKVVKDHFNLGNDYDLYSFRHTYITKLYRELAKSYAPFDTKSRLMLITGHASMTALEKYLRDIDAELPEDY
jgi:hypothetical protein